MSVPLSTSAETYTVKGDIVDHYLTVDHLVPTTSTACENINVPIYSTSTTQGDPAGSALLGMLIGAIAGKAATGRDQGAAAGAVIGGAIGADRGARPRSSTVIVGYRQERQCNEVVEYINHKNSVYDYSSITFTLNGIRYDVNFVK